MQALKDSDAAAAYCKLDAKLLPLVEFEPETPAIPEFREQYARARAHQAEYFVEEIPLIADDGRNDFMEKQRRDGTTFLIADTIWPRSSRASHGLRSACSSRARVCGTKIAARD
jgi:hypothetical protein